MRINNKGLSFVELLIVVSIIAILVLLAISYFRSQILKGRDAKRKADINRIQIAVEEYEKDHNCYPPPELLICDPGTGLKPYLDKIPCDPETGNDYVYDLGQGSCPRWYRIFTNLEYSGDTSITLGVGPDGDYNYVAGSPDAPGGQYSESGDYYACKGGACVPIYWNESRNRPECSPNFQGAPDCFGYCVAHPNCTPVN